MMIAAAPKPEPQQLARLAIEHVYEEGEWLTHYGDIWPYLFIVEEGEIKAVKESLEGRSLIVTNIYPGEMFWGLAFFNENTPMWVGLQANQLSRIRVWAHDDLVPILRQNGNVMWDMTRSLVQRMQRASDIVEELAFQPVTGRLANLLLDHFGDDVGEAVARDLTLDEMAAYIGSTREMVCRQLYRFANMGVIQINRTEFMILNATRLRSLSIVGKGGEHLAELPVKAS